MPEKTGWTGTQVAVLVIVLVVTNAVTASVIFFATPTPGPTLTVYHPWSGSERDLFVPVMEAFEEAYGISVVDQTFRQEELQPLLPPQFTAEQTPADVVFMASGFIRDWGLEGWAMDLSGTIDKADFVDGVFEPVESGSALYGAAYTFKVKPGFWYKKSLFDANPTWNENPATFAEFQTLLGTIDGAGITPIVSTTDQWPLSDLTEHFIATYGGADMHRNLTTGALSWSDPSVRTVFSDFIVPTLAYADTSPVEWTVGVSELDAENNALYFQGSWLPTMSQTSNEDDMRALPLPGGVPEAQKGVVTPTDYLFIPSFTTKRAAAEAFVRFITGPVGQTIQITQGGHFATNLNADLTAAPPTYDPERLVGERQVLNDLDDTIGGEFQTTFWTQLGLLWANPTTTDLDALLAAIQADAPTPPTPA